MSENSIFNERRRARQFLHAYVAQCGTMWHSSARSTAKRVVDLCQAADQHGRKEALSFLAPALPSLAKTQQGVVRAAIEVATSSVSRPHLLV